MFTLIGPTDQRFVPRRLWARFPIDGVTAIMRLGGEEHVWLCVVEETTTPRTVTLDFWIPRGNSPDRFLLQYRYDAPVSLSGVKRTPSPATAETSPSGASTK